MAEQSKIFTGPDTQEALLADRQRMFNGFTTFTTVSTILLAVFLALMAIFLVH
jgi:hypothetical protein